MKASNFMARLGLALLLSLAPTVNADLVWGDQTDESILRSENSGANSRSLVDLNLNFGDVSGVYTPFFITAVGRTVYWMNWGTNTIYKSGINGESPVAILDTTTTGSSFTPTALTSDGTLLYFAVGGTVYSCGLDGSSPTVILNLSTYSISSPWDAHIHDGWLYLTHNGPKGVGKVKLDGSVGGTIVDMENVFGADSYSMRAITTDGLYLYWCAGGSSASGVFRSNLDGSNPVNLIPSESAWAGAIAISGDTMYFSELAGANQNIRRADLDGSNISVVLDSPAPKTYDIVIVADPNEEPITAKEAHIFRFQTQLGFDYVLQETSDLSLWTNFPVSVIHGDGTMQQFCVEKTKASGFFRVISQ